MSMHGISRKLLIMSSFIAASAVADQAAPGISAACQACHGSDGISVVPIVPNLAGQKEQYIKSQLLAFKSGDRKHDIMTPIAAQLSAGDIDTLAAFWTSLPAGGQPRDTAEVALNARKSLMSFPAGFPKGFSAYSSDEDADTNTVSTNYANDIALKAARAGKPLPSGSIIVVTNAAAQLDADKKPRKDADGHLMAGEVVSYSAMESRTGFGAGLPQLLKNGDWQYALFDAKHERRDKQNYALCFGCHKAVETDSFVFTAKKLRDKAVHS
jgi:cytochrome c553